MLSSTARFADDAAGLEKAMRLIQGLCTFLVGVSTSEELSGPFTQARSQLALGRRYFRLLKWHSCWDVAYEALQRDEDAFTKLLEVGNWSFLGLYYFLEMPTITNAMSVTHYSWGPFLQSEADKCWFYAITFSIILSLYRLLYLFVATDDVNEKGSGSSPTRQNETSKEGKQGKHKSKAYGALFVRLAIDCCDLTIPGSSTGWIPVELAVVGAAQFTSSALAGLQIWRRVQLSAVR